MVTMAPPTATRHPLPFDELSSEDFERLCLFLVRKLGFKGVEHLGAAGADGGRDITGWEVIDGEHRLISFQCKRARARLNVGAVINDVMKVSNAVRKEGAAKPYRLHFFCTNLISSKARQAIRNACEREGFEATFSAKTELDAEVKQFPELVAEFFALAVEPGISSPVPPCTLPPPSRRFVNRKSDLQRLQKIMGRATAHGLVGVAVVCGGPGIGKSSLCLQWAHANKQDYPDGQLFVDFERWREHGGVRIDDVMEHLLTQLGVNSQALPPLFHDRVDLYRRITQKRRVIIIADGADTSAQAEVLIPEGIGSCLLVTTRHRMPRLIGLGGRQLDLNRLDESAAKRLVTTIAGRTRLRAEPVEVAELMSLCNGLPLLLTACASGIAGSAPGSAARLLAAVRDSPTAPRLELARASSMSATLDGAYDALSPELATNYRLVVGSPLPDITASAAAALLATSISAAARACDDLAAASLVEPVGTQHWRAHNLLREHARSIPEPEGGVRAASLRHAVTWFAIATSVAERTMVRDRPRLGLLDLLRHNAGEPPSFGSAHDAVQWWRSERLNVLACAQLASEHGWLSDVLLIGEAVWPFVASLKNFSEWERSQRLAAAAALRVGDARAEARFRSQLARVLAETGRHKEAREESAAAISAAVKADDPIMLASTIEFDGVCKLEALDFGNAIASFDEALPRFAAAGIPRGVALQHYYASRALLGLGRPEEALKRLAEAFDDFVIAGDDVSVTRAWLRRAEAYLDLGSSERAVDALMAALQTATLAGLHFEQAEAHDLLAQAADLRGDPAAAAADRANALEIYRKLGHPRALPQSRSQLL